MNYECAVQQSFGIDIGINIGIIKSTKLKYRLRISVSDLCSMLQKSGMRNYARKLSCGCYVRKIRNSVYMRTYVWTCLGHMPISLKVTLIETVGHIHQNHLGQFIKN